jgi:hypothetical protein
MAKPPEPQTSLIDKIKQTGFILEHKVACLFEQTGWSVIHNRYYLDDVLNQQREIDMVAYKTYLIKDLRFCTALIISCKKSDLYEWVFLTRKAQAMNYNLNLYPITFASNIDELNFEFKLIDWPTDTKEANTPISKLIKKLYEYEESVFAFKEFKESNDKGRSDSAIFDSISSLIKAQSFETRSLKNRRKAEEKYVYNFNLLSISDINFIKLLFEKDKINETKISRINYINRFLVNGEEQHSKIDFINLNSLNKAIADYNNLHNLNIDFFKKLEERFYDNIWTLDRTNFVVEKQRKDFLTNLRSLIYSKLNVSDSDFIYLELIKHPEYLLIDCCVTTELEKYLDSDKRVQSFCKRWLKEHFRYDGSFTFGDNLPF